MIFSDRVFIAKRNEKPMPVLRAQVHYLLAAFLQRDSFFEMELRQLRHFVAVVAHGNFSRAAKALHLTQPALSRQVKNLEDELGVTLLKRETNSTTLTHNGRQLYDEARDILVRVDKAIRSLKKEKSEEALRVGYVPDLVAGFFPCVLSRFEKTNHGIAAELFDLSPREIAASAVTGNVDVTIGPRGIETLAPTFHWSEVKQVSSVLVMARNHPLAKLTKIDPKILVDKPLYALSSTTYPNYTQRLRSALRPLGIRPKFVNQTADGLSSLFVSIEADLGLAILPQDVKHILPAKLTSKPFFPGIAPLTVMVGTAELHPKPQAEMFIKLLLEAATTKNLKWR